MKIIYYLLKNICVLLDTRLSNFGVNVGYDDITNANNMLCHYEASAVANGDWFDAVCPHLLVGRFVSLNILGPSVDNEQILTICEVEVYASCKYCVS